MLSMFIKQDQLTWHLAGDHDMAVDRYSWDKKQICNSGIRRDSSYLEKEESRYYVFFVDGLSNYRQSLFRKCKKCRNGRQPNISNDGFPCLPNVIFRKIIEN